MGAGSASPPRWLLELEAGVHRVHAGECCGHLLLGPNTGGDTEQVSCHFVFCLGRIAVGEKNLPADSTPVTLSEHLLFLSCHANSPPFLSDLLVRAPSSLLRSGVHPIRKCSIWISESENHQGTDCPSLIGSLARICLPMQGDPIGAKILGDLVSGWSRLYRAGSTEITDASLSFPPISTVITASLHRRSPPFYFDFLLFYFPFRLSV